MEEYNGRMLQFPLSKLNIMGFLNFNTISLKKQLFLVVLGLLSLFCYISTFLQYFYMEPNIFEYTENSEAFVGVTQILIKMACCIVYQAKFRNLIQLSKQFWSTESCSNDLKNEINDVRQKIILFQKIFFRMFVILSPTFMATTLFGKKLPLGSWSMENEGIFYRSVFVAYALIIPPLIYFVTCYEGLFLGFCYEIKTQFMILSDTFKNLSVDHIRSREDFGAYNQQLQRNIQHHILLIKFVNELQKTYSLTFMVQSITIIPLICSEWYVSTESTSLLWTVRCVVLCIAIIVQFGFYCIPGSFVIDEASVISDGIYNSDWFSNGFPQLRMPIVFLIQMAQKELKFTAYDIIPININTLVKVVKLAFSTNALLKSLKE